MASFIISVLTFLSFSSTELKAIDPEFKAELEKIYNPHTPTISIEDYLQLNNDNLYILDAREEDEFNVSHLRNAKNVGYIWFDMRNIYHIPKDGTIVVYCSVGNRAQKIADILIRSGYKNVFNLYGGIFAWVNEGLPVYTYPNAQTSQIHAYNKRWSVWLEQGTKVL